MDVLNKSDICKEHHDILAAALDSMQKQMFLTDVMITCMDQELAAHRVILSAGSPYFRAMFSNNMSESNSGKVVFKHISPHSMQVILEFLYTGHIGDIENDTEKLKDILSAAHLLQVKLVYDYCWQVLQDSLSVEQCFDLWELADFYQNTQMLETIIMYMVENFCLIVASTEFPSLPIYKLETLLKHPLLDISSDVLLKKLIEWAQYTGQAERKQELLRLTEFVDFDSVSNEFISAATNDDFIKTSSTLLCKLLTVAVSRAGSNSLRTSGSSSNEEVILGAQVPLLRPEKSIIQTEKKFVRARTIDKKLANSSPFQHEPLRQLAAGSVKCHSLSSMVNHNPCFPVNALLVFVEPNHMYVLDLNTKNWRPCKCLPFELQCGMTSVYTGESVLFVGGGKFPKQALSTVFKYDLHNNSFKIMTTCHHRRFCPGAVKLEQRVYVVGGKNRNCEPLRYVEVYNMDNGVWTTAASTAHPYFHPNVIVVEGIIFVVGSCGQGVIEMFNEVMNQWSRVTCISRDVNWPLRVARHNQYIWAVDCIERKAYIYSVSNKTWIIKKIIGTEQIAEVCSGIVIADQEAFPTMIDETGVVYKVNPSGYAVRLAENVELRQPHLSKWVHIY